MEVTEEIKSQKEAHLRDMLKVWYLFQNKRQIPDSYECIEVYCREGKPLTAHRLHAGARSDSQIENVLDQVAKMTRFFYATSCSFVLHVRFDGHTTFVTDVTLAS